MMMDLSGKVRVILFGRLEHHLSTMSVCAIFDVGCRMYLRSIGEFVLCQVNLPKRTLSYEPPKRVVADRSKLL